MYLGNAQCELVIATGGLLTAFIALDWIYTMNPTFFTIALIKIMLQRVTSSRAHLRGLAPGQHGSEGTLQRWPVVGDTLLI